MILTMESFKKFQDETLDEVSIAEWDKILTSASSIKRLFATKSPWQTADLALLVENKWDGNSRYNLKALSFNRERTPTTLYWVGGEMNRGQDFVVK